MFDEPPANLPVEPKPGAGPLPKPPIPPEPSTAEKPPSAEMQGGIMVPKKTEPEDILEDVERAEGARMPEVPEMTERPPSRGKFKLLIIILSAVVIVLILVIAGIFFYRQFIAVEPEEVSIEGEILEQRAAPTTPTIPPTGGIAIPGEEGSEVEEEEAPPVVPPTPPPPDIPEPTPVAPEPEGDDADNDGLSDTEEVNAGTDPRIADTDGDGLLDGNEINVGTDPLVADTDGDGLTDSDEVNIWLSNPTLKDTDGDGYEDGAEVQNGYNPNGEGRLPGEE